MTKPDNKSKPTPAARVRAILNGAKNEGSAINRLPKVKPAGVKSVSETAPVSSPPPAAPKAESDKRGFQLLPAFWTIASIVSLAVNIILLAVLIGAMHGLDVSGLGQMGTGLVGGLYSNFEKMDAAHIKTTIPVQSNIPLSMSIPVQTTTNISLASAVEIPNAHVKISTGTFNINLGCGCDSSGWHQLKCSPELQRSGANDCAHYLERPRGYCAQPDRLASCHHGFGKHDQAAVLHP